MKGQIENFILKERIRPGGQSIVYKAVEDRQGVTRDAAIKILKDFDPGSDDDQTRFRQEVQVLSDLTSVPGVVTIYQFGIDEEHGAWIAMELLGASLADSLSDGPGDPTQLPGIMRDVLGALQVLHSAEPPILQRDVKPANILLSPSGTYKLADFGNATRTDSTATMSKMTVRYAAPETLDGALGKIGPAADMYSLGMTLYEWALGHTLFRQQFPSVFDIETGEQTTAFHDDARRWMYWHCSPTQTAKPLAEVIPGFPAGLSDLIARLMIKDQNQRLSNAGEALQLLAAACQAPAAAGAPMATAPSMASAAPMTPMASMAAPAPQKLRSTLPPPDKSSNTARTVVIVVVTLLVLAAGTIAFMMTRPAPVSPPTIALSGDSGLFQSTETEITVSGTLTNIPVGAMAKIKSTDGTIDELLSISENGTFSATIPMPAIGKVDAQLLVASAQKQVLSTTPLTLERLAPPDIKVTIRTDPPVAGAVVHFMDADTGKVIAELTTDASGSATQPLPFGEFKVAIDHTEFERRESGRLTTGSGATREIMVPLTTVVAPVDFVIEPVTATVMLQADGEPRPRPITLDANGKATERLPFGKYLVSATAEGHHPKSDRLNVEPGQLPVVRFRLDRVDVPRAGRVLTKNEIMRLNSEEFINYLRETAAPLRQLKIEPLATQQHLLSGPVLNDAELAALMRRLEPSSERLLIEVVSDENAVENAIRDALTRQGAKDVRVSSLSLSGDRRVYVYYKPTADCTKAYATEIAGSFVLNKGVLEMKAQ